MPDPTPQFRWEPAYRALALPFGVTPGRCRIELDERSLRVRFGPWRVVTGRANVAGVSVTGPYRLIRTAGPARLTLSDRGLTFASNGRRGVQLDFHRPVTGIDPFGWLHHPNLTLTVEDCDALAAALAP